ncbi:hypothetical protein ANN_13762 [Periplaneta americana]|uniref:Uncharacterized protein n=1 Tax=Periplaneta americana TaxID=6978 RepID=A0ABQ8SVF3_PERAM|nr:hypothetical protein ANN_13762 [Periplaneta americana]
MKKETKEKIAEAVSVIRKCFIAWKTSAENEQNEKKKPQNEVTTANKEDKQREDNSSERQVAPSIDPAQEAGNRNLQLPTPSGQTTDQEQSSSANHEEAEEDLHETTPYDMERKIADKISEKI